jgi:hypothetical protein
MDKNQISEVLDLSVDKLTEQLPSLDRESLVELQAQEAAGKNRATALAAIDAALIALDGEPGDEQGDKTPTGGGEKVDPAPKGAGKIPTVEKIPATDFRHPDYTGPLDGEQAAWRVANIKPVREARTK